MRMEVEALKKESESMKQINSNLQLRIKNVPSAIQFIAAQQTSMMELLMSQNQTFNDIMNQMYNKT